MSRSAKNLSMAGSHVVGGRLGIQSMIKKLAKALSLKHPLR